MEVHALKNRGWSISAIARHLGRDRKTVRSYLEGERAPGRRRQAAPDPLAPFEGYIRARFGDDHNLWATALFDEVVLWVMTGVTRRSRGRSGSGSCGRIARRARG